MLVSSIGYFNNRNNAHKNYSVNTQIMNTSLRAGFGHVQDNETPIEKNILSQVIDKFKAMFSNNKNEKNDNSVSVIV